MFGGPTSGLSFMTAGLVLAVMMIPIVTAVSREVLATISQEEKNAALAMGATRWEMLRACVFPRCAQRARRAQSCSGWAARSVRRSPWPS